MARKFQCKHFYRPLIFRSDFLWTVLPSTNQVFTSLSPRKKRLVFFHRHPRLDRGEPTVSRVVVPLSRQTTNPWIDPRLLTSSRHRDHAPSAAAPPRHPPLVTTAPPPGLRSSSNPRFRHSHPSPISPQISPRPPPRAAAIKSTTSSSRRHENQWH